MKSEKNLAQSPVLHARRAQGYMVAVEAMLRETLPISRTVRNCRPDTVAASFFFRQGLSGSSPG